MWGGGQRGGPKGQTKVKNASTRGGVRGGRKANRKRGNYDRECEGRKKYRNELLKPGGEWKLVKKCLKITWGNVLGQILK